MPLRGLNFAKLAQLSWDVHSREHTKYPEYPPQRMVLMFDVPGAQPLECCVASTPELQQRGLQGFERLGKNQGALFVFDQPKTTTFHMGEVKFPIDIMFVGSDSRVNKIVYGAQPGDDSTWSMGRVALVVEAPAGFAKSNGIKVGTLLSNVQLVKSAQAQFPTHPRPDVNPSGDRPDLNKAPADERFKGDDLLEKQIEPFTKADPKHWSQTQGYDIMKNHDNDGKDGAPAPVRSGSYFDPDARAARRRERRAQYSLLSASSPRKKAPGKITRQNIGHKAMQFVSDYLSEYSLPGVPKYTYSGAKIASVDSGSSDVSDGLVTVSASMKTGSGVRVDFDIPLLVRNGEFLDPSLIMVGGEPRVIAQSTFNTLNDSNSIYDIKNERKMYSPPVPGAKAIVLRRPSNGMFNTQVFRNLVSSKSWAASGDTEGTVTVHEAGMFDDTHLPKPGLVMPTGEHKLLEEVQVKDRGGVTHTYPRGSKVTVINGQSDDGIVCAVRFENGVEAIIECDCLN